MRHRPAALGIVLMVGVIGRAEPPRGPTLVEQPGALQTLVNPNCSHCRDEAVRRKGELRDDDRVLCWIRGKYDGGAIPFRFFLSPYRVISDTYGVFVYDPDAGYARGFAPSLDFRFHGWYNGVMVMKHKDGTLYSCLSGRAVAGPKKGASLQPLPTLVSDWGFWLQHYPGTVAYHMFDKYKPVDLPAAASEGSLKSRGPADDREPADRMVLGVSHGKDVFAYPIDRLAEDRLRRCKIDGEAAVLLWFGPTRTAAAYLSTASPPQEGGSPRAVTLSRDDKFRGAPFIDKETGSHWDITGRAVAGELKGWTLTWIDSTQVKWYAWAAEYPRTSILSQSPQNP